MNQHQSGDQADGRKELDMNDVLRERFSKGEGVVCLQSGMSDADLVAVIKHATTFGKPFTVIPPGEPFVFLDGVPDADMLPQLQKLAEARGRSGTFIPVIFPISQEGKSLALDPLDTGTPRPLALQMLAAMAGLKLTTPQYATALTILESLSVDATVRDFVQAINPTTARRLGISAESLEALSPLLTELARLVAPGAYTSLLGRQRN